MLLVYVERFSCNKTNTLNLFYFCLICILVFLFDLWLQNEGYFQLFFSGCEISSNNEKKKSISQVCMGWVIKYNFKLLVISYSFKNHYHTEIKSMYKIASYLCFIIWFVKSWYLNRQILLFIWYELSNC